MISFFKFIFISSALYKLALPKLLMREGEPVLKVSNSNFGEYITDKNGRALYVFENDKPNVSNCKGECAKRWPPMLAGDIVFPPDVDRRLKSSSVGLFNRGDGGEYQISYNKMPLYYFSEDEGSNLKGHRIKEFSGKWSLLKPDGTPVDSRWANAMQNLPNPKDMFISVPGIASILLSPDSYVLTFNITLAPGDTNNTIPQFIRSMKDIVKDLYTNLQIQPAFVDKNISPNNELIYAYKFSTSDLKNLLNVTNKLNEINSKIGNKINYNINFAVSGDLITNAQSVIYGMAIKDSMINAGILVAPYNMVISSDNSIRSIYVDNSDMININPVYGPKSVLYPTKSGSVILTIKVNVSFNVMKKS